MKASAIVKTTYVLVGNDLDVLNMSSSLEDLAENVLGNSLVQASHVQRALVRLGSCPTKVA